MEDAIVFVKVHLLAHWPLLIVAFILGMVGRVMKKHVWTPVRARSSWFFKWARATLTLHPILAGGLIGLGLDLIFKDTVPASPGVQGAGSIFIYYAGAGALSALVYQIVKGYAQARGIDIEPVSETTAVASEGPASAEDTWPPGEPR